RLDVPYLRQVMQQASWSHAILAAVALEHLTDDGRIDDDEALELAALALLLLAIRREAGRLALATGQAATAVTAIARFEGIQQARKIIAEVLPDKTLILPPPAPGIAQHLEAVAARRHALGAFE